MPDWVIATHTTTFLENHIATVSSFLSPVQYKGYHSLCLTDLNPVQYHASHAVATEYDDRYKPLYACAHSDTFDSKQISL